MERRGDATGFCAHYSLTDSIFLFPRFAAVLNMFCILFHRLSFLKIHHSCFIIMTSKMVLIHWPAASKVFERSVFHSASNIGSVVILIFSDTKWGCLSPTSVQKNQMQWFSFGFVNKIWFVVLEQWLKTVVYSAFCFILWSCGQDTQTLHSKLSFPLMTKWSFFFLASSCTQQTAHLLIIWHGVFC